ncbi:DUF6090 family protein [Polaribacter dokdonensis]|uniref:Uncharacterized protein n=1 Tax=Polaribacter dokdonensis DSW-5 TaxID=1300348 RepID=A0A1H5ILR5_9FLAO|nr:DUF6090 family protein [Polaribacter dokdonensis]SEE41107.1 hypothetical protein SAMN05444353_1539 [Polaribacter dokdonensis DSW-5]
MLHLFKKIRQKLLVEKRLSNYIFYAIGEVFLVVIGILLAIQFSNWNEKRNEVQKEIWYLDNIANDMFYQKETLLDLKNSFEKTLLLSQTILKDYYKNNSFENVDSLSFKLNQLMSTYKYPNIDNTYEELISSGKVSLIENYDLLTDIIDFYLNTDEVDFMFSTNEEQVFYEEVYSVLIKYSEVDISKFIESNDINKSDIEIQNYILSELKKPRVKLELTNAIKNKIIIVSDYLITVDESIADVDRMISAIDTEINTLQ